MKSIVAVGVTAICLAGSAVLAKGAPIIVDLAQDSADVEIAGGVDWQLGYSLATGDINGDGAVELVMTAPRSLPLGTREGEVIIIWGPMAESPFLIDLSTIPPSQITRVFGRATDYPRFGQLETGDFNGDGYDDIVYSLPYDLGGDGKAYILMGASLLPDTIDLADVPGNYSEVLGFPYETGLLGRALCACDLDGDGYDEAVLSAPSHSIDVITVIHGMPSLLSMYDMASPPPSATTLIIDDLPYIWAGISLDCADLDDDGYEDLVFGTSGGLTGEGAVTVLFGDTLLPDTLSIAQSSVRVKRIFGESFYDGRLGRKVALGDVDGNEKWDLIASAPYADPDGCFDCGKIYVLRDVVDLPDSLALQTDPFDGFALVGETASYAYGIGLESGDLDADGRDELFVVSFGDGAKATSRARTVIVPGGGQDTTVYLDSDTTLGRVLDRAPKDDLGKGMAVGDLNADGVVDLVLGANWAHALGRNNSGIAYIFSGTVVPSGVAHAPSPNFHLYQNYPNPFNPTTRIDYFIPGSGSQVRIAIYDVRGRHVRLVVASRSRGGRQSFVWDGTDDRGNLLPSGVYFARMDAPNFLSTRKLVLLK